MATIWYSTRERVKAALDSAETARDNTAVDAALAAATVQVEALCHRRFHPQTATRYLDGPAVQSSSPMRVWLDGDHELISATSITVDGTALDAGDYVLRPDVGPPYTSIEIDDESSAAWVSGQRTIAITGVFGHSADTAPAGAVAAEIADASTTTVTVTDSARVGVGDLVRVDDEYMAVTGKAMTDTGVNIDASDSLTASDADIAVTCSTTTGMPTVGETILIDSERMLVVDVAGAVLTVKRAWDGSVLASHAAAADIWAPRTLTVERGAVGTTAVAHDDASTVARHVPPPLVSSLAVAEAMHVLLGEESGWARTVGSGESEREASGRGLAGLREQVYAAFGRKARKRAV